MTTRSLLSLKMVAEETGLPEETIQQMTRSSRFPEPMLTTGSKSFWKYQDVEQWLESHRNENLPISVKTEPAPAEEAAPAATQEGDDEMKKVLREAKMRLEPLGYELKKGTDSEGHYVFTHPLALRPVTVSSTPGKAGDNSLKNAVSFAKKQLDRSHPGWDFLDHLWKKYRVPSDGYRDVRMNLEHEVEVWLRDHPGVRSTALGISSFARTIGYLNVLRRGGSTTMSLYRFEGKNYSPVKAEDLTAAEKSELEAAEDEPTLEAKPTPEPQPEPEPAQPEPVQPAATRAEPKVEQSVPLAAAQLHPGAVLSPELLDQLRGALFPGLDEQLTASQLVNEEVSLMISRAYAERVTLTELLNNLDRRISQLQDLQRLTQRIAGEER